MRPIAIAARFGFVTFVAGAFFTAYEQDHAAPSRADILDRFQAICTKAQGRADEITRLYPQYHLLVSCSGYMIDKPLREDKPPEDPKPAPERPRLNPLFRHTTLELDHPDGKVLPDAYPNH